MECICSTNGYVLVFKHQFWLLFLMSQNRKWNSHHTTVINSWFWMNWSTKDDISEGLFNVTGSWASLNSCFIMKSICDITASHGRGIKVSEEAGRKTLSDAQCLLWRGSQASFSPPLPRVLRLRLPCSTPRHLLPLYQLIYNYPASAFAFFICFSPRFPFSVNLFPYLLHPTSVSSPLPVPSFRSWLIHLLSNRSLISVSPLCLIPCYLCWDVFFSVPGFTLLRRLKFSSRWICWYFVILTTGNLGFYFSGETVCHCRHRGLQSCSYWLFWSQLFSLIQGLLTLKK